MDFKSLGQMLIKNAPLVGTLLGGPGGAALGGLIASTLGAEPTPDAIAAAVSSSPDALVKIKQIEADHQEKMQAMVIGQAQAEIAGSVQNAGNINTTMQSEAASDHWPTYGWRPAIGFAVAFNTFASGILVLIVFGPVMFGVKAASDAISNLPLALGALAAVNGTVLPILGIASYFRGKMQADPSIPTDNRG